MPDLSRHVENWFRERLDERVAIMIVDGGLDRPTAERKAREAIEKEQFMARMKAADIESRRRHVSAPKTFASHSA